MVGGGNRKNESLVLNNTNVFAALDTLRKKKKSSASDKTKQCSSKPNSKQTDAEKEVFWAPAPLTVKSWADVDDEDDDDYYATTAPSVSDWGAPPGTNHENEAEEVSESEEEGLDEVDDDIEEEHENGNELEASLTVDPVIKKPSEASSSNKEPERQLSKKELKKKGLEELDSVLAELGYPKQDIAGRDDSHGAVKEEKAENRLEVEKTENVLGESKSSKKKKKKEKVLKESEEQPQGADVGEAAAAEETEKAEDVKARLKKVTSTKKKKSSKEIDAAARAAAVEAAARRAKLAAAKKKEKTHYNQQPVR